MSAQAALVARVVAKTIGTDVLGQGGIEQVEGAVARRVHDALSGVPALRVATAGWLIDASGTDAPDALDLLVESARAGLREVASDGGWDAKILQEREARVEAALRAVSVLAG